LSIRPNELELHVLKGWKKNDTDAKSEEVPVPDALKKLAVKVIREGDKIALEIPKNEAWEAIRVTR
jgi:hypothetical protein